MFVNLATPRQKSKPVLSGTDNFHVENVHSVAHSTKKKMVPIEECTIRVMRKGHDFILGAQSQWMIFAQ